MMTNDEEEALDPDALEELLDTEDELDEEPEDEESLIDEFGAGGDEELKARDWE